MKSFWSASSLVAAIAVYASICLAMDKVASPAPATTSPPATAASKPVTCIPVPHPEGWGRGAHEMFLRDAKQGDVDLVLLGDSITENWKSCRPASWAKYFGHGAVNNMGICGDRTQTLLWRLTEGKELDGMSPKLVILMIGTNNLGDNTAEDIAAGIAENVSVIKAKCPKSKMLLMAILPRAKYGGNPYYKEKIPQVNKVIAKLEDRKSVWFLDLREKYVDQAGEAPLSLIPDGVHLIEPGYKIWAENMAPLVKELANYDMLATPTSAPAAK